MNISVIVPCRNAGATLGAQLDALAQQSRPPWEVIVADNGSTDGSGDVARTFANRLNGLRVVDAGGRPGAAHARNVGASAATGEVLAFCDADDVVDRHWIAGIERAMARHDFVASRFQVAWPSALNRPRHPQETGLQCNEYAFLPHAGGSGLAIRREIHRAVGGFDETLAYLEDTDYCWRVQLAGTPLAFAEAALMTISIRSTSLQVFLQSLRWATCDVKLYRRYRSYAHKPDNRHALQDWLRFPSLMWKVSRGRYSRRAFARLVGLRCGRLCGSVVYLTLLM